MIGRKTQIEFAHASDFVELASVARKAYEENYPGLFSKEQLELQFNKAYFEREPIVFPPQKTIFILIAKYEKHIIGYAKLVLQENHFSYLDKLYVLSEFKNQGCGYLLLQSCFSVSVALDRPHMQLLVYDKNAAAQKFYEKQGFERFGEIIENKDFPGVRDYRMKCDDVAAQMRLPMVYHFFKPKPLIRWDHFNLGIATTIGLAAFLGCRHPVPAVAALMVYYGVTKHTEEKEEKPLPVCSFQA